jgi:hypothetical protein
MSMNLDDRQERQAFLDQYKTLQGRALANRLGLKGKGSAKVATMLSCYAWNAETAYRERQNGHIDVAMRYEEIADRIYQQYLKVLGWW